MMQRISYRFTASSAFVYTGPAIGTIFDARIDHRGERIMPIATEDYVSVSDLMGSYCWHVDAGNEAEWLNLWTDDGTFSGATPQPLVGHEQLKLVIAMSNQSDGKLRHMIGNLNCSYGDTPDTILARFYNLVTDWTGGGSFKVFATCNAVIVRSADGWKVKRNDAQMFVG
jgi:hypothetical protein